MARSPSRTVRFKDRLERYQTTPVKAAHGISEMHRNQINNCVLMLIRSSTGQPIRSVMAGRA
jgi:hypothetical protein